MQKLCLFSFGFLLLVCPLWAQHPGGVVESGSPVMTTVAEPAALPVDIEADSLEYLTDRKLIVGTGNVQIREGADILKADYITVQTGTREVYARGNVMMRREGKVWQGQELRYNLQTKQGDFGEFQAFVDPFFIRAEDSKRISEDHYELKGLTLTTCDNDPPDFSFRAREATLTEKTKIKAKGVTLYFGSVPVFWLPRLDRDLAGNRSYWQFEPGYSSRKGAYMLTGYGFRWTRNFKTVTHVDAYSKKGVGLGQDFVWQGRDTNRIMSGALQTYYIDDQEPFHSDSEQASEEDLVDNERYRIRLTHNQSFSDRDYSLTEINYVSDPDMIKDFFDEEYRNSSQPENRASLTHRGDHYTAGALLNGRMNDFYENVNRLPELSLDASRQQLGDSRFYYESKNRISWLDRVFPEGDDKEDYNALRIDSSHMVYYPTRHFGFLNLTPRAGYRGTYYDTTYSLKTVTNILINTDSNGVATVTNEVKDLRVDAGADLRNLYEVGFESSFKAFRTWDDLIVMGDGDGLRHVAEPYVKHTYTPEPNMLPEDLPQFDSVDGLGERHDLRLGMRNKFQTRRDKQVEDLMDANVYTTYRIYTEEEEEDFTDVFFDVQLNLVAWLPMDFDGRYDPYDSSFRTFNSQIAYLFPDESSLALEYRYYRDEQNQIAVEALLFPQDRWSFKGYARWDAEADGLQEYSLLVQRKTRCIGYGLGFGHVLATDYEEDDYRVWAQFWLTDLPEASLDLGRGN